jgi:hypothetical protein
MAVTRTPVVPNPGAVNAVTSQGQFLQFTLEASGPIAIFSFASSVKGVLFEAPDFSDHPTTRYEWLHLRNPSDIRQFEVLNLGLAFLSNARYTYRIKRRARDNSDLGTVLEVSFSGGGIDTISESLTVIIS